jgi:hypothetical protein
VNVQPRKRWKALPYERRHAECTSLIDGATGSAGSLDETKVVVSFDRGR